MIFKGMTPKEVLAQLWAWLTSGFTPASLALGISSDMMIFVIWVKTEYGMQIQIWMSVVIILVGMLCLVLLGYIWFKTGFQVAVNVYLTDSNKPWMDFMKKYDEDMKEIKKRLKE